MSYTDKIVTLAKTWVGTPYHHQASVRGVGCDCLGLIRGIWRELYGAEPEQTPSYSPSWGDVSSDAPLLAAAQRNFIDTNGDMTPGNLLILYVKNARSPKHCAILSGPDTMIHAYSGSGVVETSLGYWRNQIAGVFAFPERPAPWQQ